MTKELYLDNASTSHPKPNCVWETMKDYQINIGSSPGRAGHWLARNAEEQVSGTRSALADYLGCANPEQMYFSLNATHALNMIIQGVLSDGDHVITSSLEHNSVLRPLELLRRRGQVEYTVVRSDPCGHLDPEHFAEAIQPNTRLIAVTHGSNVLGVVTPVEQIIRVAHAAGVKVLVDASQTAGAHNVDVDGWNVDFVAFTGHKSLLGPSGTGGFYVRDPMEMDYLMAGGTGNNSHSLLHPESGPHKFEAGTQNYMGVAALGSSIRFVRKLAASDDYDPKAVTRYCLDRFSDLEFVQMYGSMDCEEKLPVVSFNVAGMSPSQVGYQLDSEFGIMTRTGLHCAPLAHEPLGTDRQGTVRVSFGYANTCADVDYLVESVASLVH